MMHGYGPWRPYGYATIIRERAFIHLATILVITTDQGNQHNTKIYVAARSRE